MEKSVFEGLEKQKVDVVLMGQRLSLRTDKSQEYLQMLANFVSDQIEDIRKGSRTVSNNQSVLLVSIKLADMLKQREDELFTLKDAVRKKAGTALKDVEDALAKLSPGGEITEENKDQA